MCFFELEIILECSSAVFSFSFKIIHLLTLWSKIKLGSHGQEGERRQARLRNTASYSISAFGPYGLGEAAGCGRQGTNIGMKLGVGDVSTSSSLVLGVLVRMCFGEE